MMDFTQPLALRTGYPLGSLRTRLDATRAEKADAPKAGLTRLSPVLEGVDVNGIAHLNITGAIFQTDRRTASELGFTRPADIEEALYRVKEDADIKGAIFEIDSPGGQTQGIQELADVIYTLDKPTMAFTRGECCSAAYWLASQCDKVMATRAATVGSLGVYCVVEDNSKEMANLGVECVLFSTGAVKGAGEFGVPLTTAQREFMQSSVDALGNLFLATIQRKRTGFDASHFTGAYWLGEQAIELGLVDDLIF